MPGHIPGGTSRSVLMNVYYHKEYNCKVKG